MTAIKALEELREYVNTNWTCQSVSWALLNEAVDNIEAEIAERYMRLPVDIHDAPIHVGDEIQQLNHAGVWTDAMPVIAVDENGCFALVHGLACEARIYAWGNNCRHVEPRTLEDVLRDVWKEALDYAKSDMWRSPDEVFSERADEIRGLLGVDE